MTAVKATYRSGWCTTGAAAWSHVKCSGTYGHPPYEAACGCTCHDLAYGLIGEAFAYAKAAVYDIIDDPLCDGGVAEWFPIQVAPALVDRLHAAYPDLWNVAIPAVQVPQ